MFTTAIHRQAELAAQQGAIRLMAFADTVWTGEEAFLDLVVEQILNESVSFSVNARRILDATGKTNSIQQSDWSPESGEQLQIETDLRRALNAIIHASDLKVRVSKTSRQKFNGSENVQTHGLLANTDRFSNIHIDLFGMAWSYLTMERQSAETKGKN